MTDSTPTGRIWRWGFGNVVTDTVDGMADVIVSMDVILTLVDYDLDMQEVNAYPCDFDAPDPEDFVEYEDLTTENLRDWAVSKYSSLDMGWPKGREAWLQNEKQKLIDQLERRNRRQNRQIQGVIEEGA